MAIGRRKGNDYFQMFSENLQFSHEAIKYLKTVLQNFDSNEEVLERQIKELHAIEHAADESRHKLMSKLAKEFVTPIEREDIIDISKVLDDITDQLEDVLQKLYMYGVKTIRPDAIEFIEILEKCLLELEHIFSEFKDFRRSTTIHQAVIDLNEFEEDGDALYMQVMRKLFQEGTNNDPVTVLAWSEIYHQLESCCDSCESAGNLVEEVIMKNT